MRAKSADSRGAPGTHLWMLVRCTIGGEGHDPVHHPLGGFRCARCGKSGINLDEFGFKGEGYVSESERRRLVAADDDKIRAA